MAFNVIWEIRPQRLDWPMCGNSLVLIGLKELSTFANPQALASYISLVDLQLDATEVWQWIPPRRRAWKLRRQCCQRQVYWRGENIESQWGFSHILIISSETRWYHPCGCVLSIFSVKVSKQNKFVKDCEWYWLETWPLLCQNIPQISQLFLLSVV